MYSVSVVTINNLIASNNTQNGAVIIAHDGGLAWGPFPFNLQLTGINTFNSNGLDGLYFEANRGNVSITKLTADNNGGDGVQGQAGGNIILMCGSMTNNTGSGWSLQSLSLTGVVSLQGVFSYGNGTNTNPGTGVFVYVRACPLP